MKKFVVHTLSKDFKDPEGAEMWRNCKIPTDGRKRMTHKRLINPYNVLAAFCNEAVILDSLPDDILN